MYIFAKQYKKHFLWVIDRISVVVALAGFFIRSGNLMNSEIFGDATTLPWGMIFVRYFGEGYAVAHHPTQIYEALSYLVLFIFLYKYYWKHNGAPPEGALFGYFLLILWSIRFLIEFIKLPQVDFENTMFLNMGQLLSIPLIIAGAYFVRKSQKH
jgi:prolipoprotein diacylglyceryltransferase